MLNWIVWSRTLFTFKNNWWPSQLGLQNTLIASRQKGKIPLDKCSGYDTKQYDGEASVMLEFWGMQSTTLLPSLWPEVIATDASTWKLHNTELFEIYCFHF